MALALGLGILGGSVFLLLDLPLPWMLGSMLATTVATMAGLRLAMPAFLRTPMLALLGVLLGSGFTMELVAGIGGWLPTIAALPLYVVLIGGISMAYLAKVTRFDVRSAFFAGTPGGFGEMVLMGDRYGGDARRISLVHAVRVLMIVFTVPFVIEQFGIAIGDEVALERDEAGGWSELALLLGSAALGGWLGTLLRLPAPGLLGAMIVSALAHMAGIVEGAPPGYLIGLAQLVIGTSIGARFSGFPLHEVVQSMLAGLGLTVLMFALTLAIGAVLHLSTGVPVLVLVLALAPGGVAEMSLIALALGIDPAFVALHHIIRIALVVLIAPVAFRVFERFMPKAPGPVPPAR